ncbi:MAG: AAA family ATPase, partial [Candidatus Aminicenantes bacterium]|nr:AAA family ATPase [Candidatus Aminicenantes bacterium]
MRRYLEEPIKRDLGKKIVLVSGPRQVGKTTLSRQLFES